MNSTRMNPGWRSAADRLGGSGRVDRMLQDQASGPRVVSQSTGNASRRARINSLRRRAGVIVPDLNRNKPSAEAVGDAPDRGYGYTVVEDAMTNHKVALI